MDTKEKVDFLLELAHAGINLSASATILLKLLREGFKRNELQLGCSKELAAELATALGDLEDDLNGFHRLADRVLKKPH